MQLIKRGILTACKLTFHVIVNFIINAKFLTFLRSTCKKCGVNLHRAKVSLIFALIFLAIEVLRKIDK